MIEEFIDFVSELFPCISPYTHENVKTAIHQFYDKSKIKTYNLFKTKPLEYLAQGDIIEIVPFIIYDEDGNQSIYKTKAILISNTCDSERDDNILFAPLLKISELYLDMNQIKNNTYFNFLFFPGSFLSEYVVDLSLINSFSQKFIINSLKNNYIKKISSLNRFGYYFLICKLTVHLLRPEDTKVNEIDRENIKHQ
ncbi:MAG: hypothetical protein KAT05_02370 [Spirochaetes bacterium]|nr:hypothetical protein [Spirochaetota bacterium]